MENVPSLPDLGRQPPQQQQQQRRQLPLYDPSLMPSIPASAPAPLSNRYYSNNQYTTPNRYDRPSQYYHHQQHHDTHRHYHQSQYHPHHRHYQQHPAPAPPPHHHHSRQHPPHRHYQQQHQQHSRNRYQPPSRYDTNRQSIQQSPPRGPSVRKSQKRQNKRKVNLDKMNRDLQLPKHITEQVKEIAQINDDPKALAKYLEERKRKFPTKDSIKRKLENPEKHAVGQKRGRDSESEIKTIENEIKSSADTDCKWYLRNSCKAGRSCSFKHDPVAREKALTEYWQRPRKQGSLKLPKPDKTFLAKLLETELQDEQNTILQCIHFLNTEYV